MYNNYKLQDRAVVRLFVVCFVNGCRYLRTEQAVTCFLLKQDRTEIRNRGLVMQEYQRLALCKIRESAKKNDEANINYLQSVCAPLGIDCRVLIRRLLQSPVTINFHPDRFSSNGKTVLENLMKQGRYHGQFCTGTTNGGKTAYIGGSRFLWEQRLFRGAYPDNVLDRPKYGALNILRYLDGASVRFGSCYFVMKKEIVDRCTFSYGDSSLEPTTLCTKDTFAGVAADLLRDVQNNNGSLLNQVVSSKREALAILLNRSDQLKHIGRDLDQYIEVHIHGDISLAEDAESFYMDESFRQTVFAEQAGELCCKYGIRMEWIPERQVKVNEIDELFRGPALPGLAKKIDYALGDGRGILHAALIGKASRDSILNPDRWSDIGKEPEMFQYLKQLWHTVGYFG